MCGRLNEIIYANQNESGSQIGRLLKAIAWRLASPVKRCVGLMRKTYKIKSMQIAKVEYFKFFFYEIFIRMDS